MTIYSKAPFKHVTEFTNLTTEELFATPEFKSAVSAIASGGGLEGTNYIYVAANGTDVENAAELQAAYTTAQGMSPWYTNRITIIAAPGYYNFGSTPFIMNTDYIDLVSLDGNRSIIFNSSIPTGNIILDFVQDVYVRGVDVQTKAFQVETYYPGVTVENCKGGNSSFSSSFFNIGGKFIDCEGGDNSFGDSLSVDANGIFINCTGGNYSFGKNANGTFTNCVAANYSFGYYGNASGTFTSCKAGVRCFGFFGIASGIFENCYSSFGEAFGYAGTASGTFKNCEGLGYSFASAGTANGFFINCIGGISSFAGNSSAGLFNGEAHYCVAEIYSFANGTVGNQGTLSGLLYYCRLKNGTFRTVSGSGKTRLCIDGNNTENNQG